MSRMVSCVLFEVSFSTKMTETFCCNPSLRHRRRASIRLTGYYGYSDTRAFVIENLPTSYSHVDRIVDYINHVITMLVLHQLATKPIELPSCTRNLILFPQDSPERCDETTDSNSLGICRAC
jgi:hypothetical protein